jgi:hypothetical protein
MSNVIKSPTSIEIDNNFKSCFLAGTIGIDGKSENWQQYVSDKLSDYAINIYNPRREKWEGSLEQNINNIDLKNQINWELDALEKSDFIIMNILGDSKSPITLLELGMFIKSGKLLVSCPKEFYRYGNIQVMCYRYNVPLFDNVDDLLNDFIKNYL